MAKASLESAITAPRRLVKFDSSLCRTVPLTVCLSHTWRRRRRHIFLLRHGAYYSHAPVQSASLEWMLSLVRLLGLSSLERLLWSATIGEGGTVRDAPIMQILAHLSGFSVSGPQENRGVVLVPALTGSASILWVTHRDGSARVRALGRQRYNIYVAEKRALNLAVVKHTNCDLREPRNSETLFSDLPYG